MIVKLINSLLKGKKGSNQERISSTNQTFPLELNLTFSLFWKKYMLAEDYVLFGEDCNNFFCYSDLLFSSHELMKSFSYLVCWYSLILYPMYQCRTPQEWQQVEKGL